MKLEDLRFDKKEAERILRLATKRAKKDALDRCSSIDTTYDSAATYEDLVKVSKERGLNPDIVRDLVESERYKTLRKFYEILTDNVSSYIIGGLAAFTVGACVKYLGKDDLLNPILYGALVTPIVNSFTCILKDICKGEPLTKKEIYKVTQATLGIFLGHTSGWTLASLL